jgi:SAM-dependent methyltransferase
VARDLQAESINRRFWDEVAPIHGESYDLTPLLSGGHCLDPVQVRELGNLKGVKVLHLQCHIGSDTLSLARLGAEVTGADFSGESLKVALELSRRTGLYARFVHASLFDLPKVLDERFQLVYTSIGVLCWLSDLDRWAEVVAGYLAPEGVFYIMESHPFLQVFDDESEGLRVAHPYFTGGKPTDWTEGSPDYADPGYTVRNPTREFTWTMGDIYNCLTGAGLRVEWIHEYDFLHWKALRSMQAGSDGYWRLPEPHAKIPLSFSLRAVKPVAKA